MNRSEPHQLRGAVDEIDAGEGSTDERTDAIERELKDVLGAVGGEERVNDLTHRNELANTWIDAGARLHTL